MSPHSDDVVMSTFGILRRNLLPRPWFIVTVFSRSDSMEVTRDTLHNREILTSLLPRPGEALKALTPGRYRIWRKSLSKGRARLLIDLLALKDANNISRVRLAEDRKFCDSIGATFSHFGLPDVKLRRGVLVDDPLRPLSEEEGVLTYVHHQLIREMKRREVNWVLAQWPYGRRQHMDHRIVCEAATTAAREVGINMLLVDDLPYSRRPFQVSSHEIGCSYHPKLVELGPDELREKYRAMYIYMSQMQTHGERYKRSVAGLTPDTTLGGASETLWSQNPDFGNSSWAVQRRN